MTSTYSNAYVLRRAGLAVAGLFAIVLGVLYLRWLVELDPFARFRLSAKGPESVAIVLNRTKLLMFDGPQAVGECFAGRIEVMRDRNRFRFLQVRNGLYYGVEGQLRFEGEQAEYDARARRLTATSGANVWNDEMELRVPGFVYDERKGALETQGDVRGKLWGGEVVAKGLKYSPTTGTYETGPITWTGEIEFLGQGAQGRLTRWEIAADRTQGKGDVIVYKNFRATDGEVIVRGPEAEWDRKSDVLRAKGRVQYFGLDANLVCDEVVVYRKEKRAVLSGNVTMLIKAKDDEKLEEVEILPLRPTVPDELLQSRPAPPDRTEEQRKQEEEVRSTRNLRKYPVSVYAQKIEYWYAKGSRRAEITGDPQAFQELPGTGWRRAWAPKALYDGEKETLRMVSSEGKKDTRVLTSIGDDLVAQWFQVSTKDTEEDEWEGEGIEGTVYVREGEERPVRRTGGSNPPPRNRRPRG